MSRDEESLKHQEKSNARTFVPQLLRENGGTNEVAPPALTREELRQRNDAIVKAVVPDLKKATTGTDQTNGIPPEPPVPLKEVAGQLNETTAAESPSSPSTNVADKGEMAVPDNPSPAEKAVKEQQAKDDSIGGTTGTPPNDVPLTKQETGAASVKTPVATALPLTTEKAPPDTPPPPKQVAEASTVPELKFIIFYKTCGTEAVNVRKNVLEKLISERIDAMSLPFATVGTQYDVLLDFTNKAISDMFGGIKILQIFSCSDLEKIGLMCEIEGDSSLRISGSPVDVFEGRLFFCAIHEDDVPIISETLSGIFSKFDRGEVTCGDLQEHMLRYPKPFIINAHPRSLWNDVRVADDEGYPHPDTDDKGVEIEIETAPGKKEKVEIMMASRRGRSHAHAGTPRDDSFYYEIDEQTGWNFVAVADGAGSAKYSRKGSKIACETVVKELRSRINAEYEENFLRPASDIAMKFARSKAKFLQDGGKWEEGKWQEAERQEFIEATKMDGIFHRAVYEAIAAIHEEVKMRPGTTVRDYHTTLLCAAFKYFGPPNSDPTKLSGWLFASYWVGDGGAALLRWDGTDRVMVLGKPDSGEFSGQTLFLTVLSEAEPEKIKSRLRFSFCDTFEALLLVTDGITDPFFPSEAAVADEPRWLEFYEEKLKSGCEEEPSGCKILFDPTKPASDKSAALLEWLNFWSKGNHDDRTILIVKPKESVGVKG